MGARSLAAASALLAAMSCEGAPELAARRPDVSIAPRIAVTQWWQYGGSGVWAPDGRHVAFVPGKCPDVGAGIAIVDVTTWQVVRVDGCVDAKHLVFSPDGARVAIATGAEYTAHGLVLSVIDADTGAIVALPRPTAAIGQYFTAAGDLLWTDEDAQHVFVHVVTAAGRETTLAAPAEPEATRRMGFHGVEHVWFVDGLVVGWTHEHVFVWRAGALVASSTLRNEAPLLDGDRLVYRLADRRLAVLDLAHLERGAVALPTVGACNAADDPSGVATNGVSSSDDEAGAPERCERDRYIVNEPGHACLWDVAAGRLVRSVSRYHFERGTCTPGTDDLTALYPYGAADEAADAADAGNDEPTNEPNDDPDVAKAAPIPAPCSGSGAGSDAGPTLDLDADGARVLCAPHRPPVRLAASRGFDSVAVAPDARFVAGVVAETGRAQIWDAATGQVRWALPAGTHAGDIRFDDATGALILPGREHDERELALELGVGWTVPAELACALGHGSPAELAARVACRREYLGGDNHLYAVAGRSVAYYAPDEHAIRVVPDGDRARAWTVPRSGAFAGDRFDARIRGLVVSDDGAYVAEHDVAGGIELHGRAGRLWSLPAGSVPGSDVALEILTGVGPARLVGHDSYLLRIWDAAGRQILQTVDARAVAIARDGRRYAIWMRDGGGELSVRDLVTGAVSVLARPAPGADIGSLAWSRDGARLAAVLGGGVAVWDVDTGRAPTRIYASDDAAVAIDGDDGVHVFGDPATARELIACRIGARLYPYAICEALDALF